MCLPASLTVAMKGIAMSAIRRVLVTLALLACGAAAGAYVQEPLKVEDPALNEVVQTGVLYSGSICSEDHKPGYSEFYFRVTRRLENSWVEAEYNTYMAYEYSRYSFKPMKKPMRLNLAQMCGVQVFSQAE